MVGLENCGSLFTRLKKKQLIAEKFLARHFLVIQQAIEMEEWGNVYWIPGLGYPASGLTKLKSDLLPLLRLIGSGSYNPGNSRPFLGEAFRGK